MIVFDQKGLLNSNQKIPPKLNQNVLFLTRKIVLMLHMVYFAPQNNSGTKEWQREK